MITNWVASYRCTESWGLFRTAFEAAPEARCRVYLTSPRLAWSPTGTAKKQARRPRKPQPPDAPPRREGDRTPRPQNGRTGHQGSRQETNRIKSKTRTPARHGREGRPGGLGPREALLRGDPKVSGNTPREATWDTLEGPGPGGPDSWWSGGAHHRTQSRTHAHAGGTPTHRHATASTNCAAR